MHCFVNYAKFIPNIQGNRERKNRICYGFQYLFKKEN